MPRSEKLYEIESAISELIPKMPIDALAMQYAMLVNKPTFPAFYEEKHLAWQMYQEMLNRVGPHYTIAWYDEMVETLCMVDPNLVPKEHTSYAYGWGFKGYDIRV